jgi:serpin B
MTKFASSSNQFGFDLYKKIIAKTQGNLVISPSSITTALSMTWGGAKAATASEMRQAMHLGQSPEEVMDTSGKLTAVLTDRSRPVTFRIANRLFGEKTYDFDAGYMSLTERAYGAPLERVDFRSAPEPARVLINGWVEKQTESRIKDLIPPRGVDGETRLVLVNAIYFLGDWAEPFEKGATRPSPFRLSAKETKEVPTMSRTDSYRIASRDGLSALELPYAGGDLSMVVLLPDAVDGLAAMEASMTEAKLAAILSELRSQRVWVSLPKFTINPAVSLSLRDDLMGLGMRSAFDRDRADFTGIANPANKADRLFISQVFHKGFIRVDEKGTEAAAATAVSMARAGGMPSKPMEFKADHPFSFVIRDNASGLILFMGRVLNPTTE